MTKSSSKTNRIPSTEEIDEALARLNENGVDINQLETEDLRGRWKDHPLRNILEHSGFSFEESKILPKDEQ